MENRLTEIEIKLSYLDDLLESLNRTVYRQQQQIDALQLEVRSLRQQIQLTQPADASGLREDIPPHY